MRDGEHTLLLAARGMAVLRVDLPPSAIDLARAKAAQRGLDAEFEVGDVLALDRLARSFSTVIDCGVFHVFDDVDRVRYVTSLGSALGTGGVLYFLCFSEHTPGTTGPRRVTQAEIRTAFADGWTVDRIEPAHLEVREEYAPEPALGCREILRTPRSGLSDGFTPVCPPIDIQASKSGSEAHDAMGWCQGTFLTQGGPVSVRRRVVGVVATAATLTLSSPPHPYLRWRALTQRLSTPC